MKNPPASRYKYLVIFYLKCNHRYLFMQAYDTVARRMIQHAGRVGSELLKG